MEIFSPLTPFVILTATPCVQKFYVENSRQKPERKVEKHQRVQLKRVLTITHAIFRRE